ncbi:MAG: PorV/PorQ family protein [Candidatus Marinimicrobia bacterium]|nr:PorV/PorQ family protein [Candidatus Neomarinimicrobiota bacterium]
MTFLTLSRPLYGQSEAGAIFLLISPGARAGGMGEAQVAVANDAYASFWNPAGLAFLQGSEMALMHVNWLPNLADDMYYEFFAYRKHYPYLGTLGGHLIYLNLGEQIRMGESPDDYLGTFTSYMTALTLSYSSLLSPKSSLGINAKVSYQHLTNFGAGGEKGKGTSTDFGFDIGYLRKEFLTPDLTIGLTVTNIGPKVSFIDPAQADPQPTNFTFGINYAIVNSEFNKLHLVYDVDKLLVASYPDMDWDGDGYVGGYDENGHASDKNAEYNREGQHETAHSDPIYIGIFTSWIDDWLIGGDMDMTKTSSDEYDHIIGGYDWVDNNNNGEIDADEGEMIATEGEPGESGWGAYNEYGQKEVGSAKRRTIQNELDKLVHNIGMEYWYGKYFALRAGYYYDKTGKISNPTFGVGLRFANYGFDFGYTSGEPDHPLANTMRFSLNMEF